MVEKRAAVLEQKDFKLGDFLLTIESHRRELTVRMYNMVMES